MVSACMICRERKYVGDIYLIKNEYDKKIGYVHKKCLMEVRTKKSVEKEKIILTLQDIKNIDNFYLPVTSPDKEVSIDLFNYDRAQNLFLYEGKVYNDSIILYKSGKVYRIFDKHEHLMYEAHDPFTDEEWEHLKSKIQKIRDKNKNNDDLKKDFKSFVDENSTIKTFLDGVGEDCGLMSEEK